MRLARHGAVEAGSRVVILPSHEVARVVRVYCVERGRSARARYDVALPAEGPLKEMRAVKAAACKLIGGDT